MSARDIARTSWNLKPAFAMRLHVERCLKDYGKSSTNLLLFSEEFDNSAWFKTRVTVMPDTEIAPDGTLTADKIISDGTTDPYILQRVYSVTITAGDTFTWSVWLWTDAGQPTDVQLVMYGDDYTNDGMLNALFITLTTTPIRYDMSITAPAGVTSTSITSRFDLSQTPVAGQYVYAWGAQLNEGAQLTHYTKTTIAAATSACTASAGAGNECYNTRPTCQDLPNFSVIDFTLALCARGMRIPPGETWYPYVETVRTQPSRLDPVQGLANRANVIIKLADDVVANRWLDPYIDTRIPAGGSFWPRFLACNKALHGKAVELLHGYDVTPWDWATFVTDTYMLDSLDGPDKKGKMKLVLKDPVKLADNVELPIPTRGVLLADLPQYDDIGTAQGGSANTVILHADASAVDGFYIGMAVNIYGQTGAGQERIISAYTGASRTATVSVNWLVNPDVSSLYFVQQLSFELDANGADYDVYGLPGYVRIGSEIIQFTTRVGNVLGWPATSYRAQFRTVLDDHNANDVAQLCKAFINQLYTDVIKWFYTQSGLPLANIDEAGFAALDAAWLGANYTINTAISAPVKASVYIKELLTTSTGMAWWEPRDNKVKFALAVPPSPGAAVKTLSDESALIDGSVDIKVLNNVRLTLAALYFDLAFATANIREARSYLNGAVNDDQTALNEYGVEQTAVEYSRFFNAANVGAARDFVARSVATRRDPPVTISCLIHPKDYDFKRGDYRDFLTDKIVDTTGKPVLTRALITMVDDTGENVKVEARTTIFGLRFAFFAPNGTANYPANNEYACFSQTNGLMPDGSSGYLFY